MAVAVHQPVYTWVPDFLFPPQHVQDQVAELGSRAKPPNLSIYLSSDFSQQKYSKAVNKMEVLPATACLSSDTPKSVLSPIYQIPARCTLPALRGATVLPPSPPAPPLSFLHFPPEIRLQIYSYLLQDNPIHHAHLSPVPGTDDEGYKAYTQTSSWPCGLSYLIHTNSRTLCSAASQNPQNQPSYQAGKIPTALLQSCHQIYNEARITPFHNNLFAYVSWFSSGIYAACRFTRRLKPWQMQGLRSVALDVLAIDLVYDEGNGKPSEGWIELCQMWSGVWTLHLKIKGKATGKEDVETTTDDDHVHDDATDNLNPARKVEKKARALDINSHWVVNGLAVMKHLRQIELSIESRSVSEEVKKSFCEALVEKLTSLRKIDGGDRARRVTVLYIEDKAAMSELKEVKKEE